MYHDLITEKSWKFLQELKRRYRFILIGGWAVYLYTNSLKSKDIDFICDYKTLQELKNKFELIKNERLKKYEIQMPEFDIDIYMPFFSELGIPVEDLQNMTTSIEGFTALNLEALLVTKQFAYANRKHSLKGEKDKIDILALLYRGINFKEYEKLLDTYQFSYLKKELREILTKTREVPELDLNQHAFSLFKKRLLPRL